MRSCDLRLLDPTVHRDICTHLLHKFLFICFLKLQLSFLNAFSHYLCHVLKQLGTNTHRCITFYVSDFHHLLQLLNACPKQKSMQTFPLSSMSLPNVTIVSTNSATSRSSVAIPMNMQFFSSQNSGPAHKTGFEVNEVMSIKAVITVYHKTFRNLPLEKYKSVSSSISFLSKSLLILSTLCCLLSSSRSVVLGSYLIRNKQKET